MTRQTRGLLLIWVAAVVWGCGPAEAASGDQWKTKLGVSLGYDDNVFQYSEADIALFRADTSPDRFGFPSVGDFFSTWEADAGKTISRRGKSSTDLDLDLRATVYRRDTEANNWRIRVGLEHHFDASRWLRWRVYYTPRTFLRRLYDRGTGSHLPATYATKGMELAWGQRLSPLWSGQVGVGWEQRDYNQAFPERDSQAVSPFVRTTYAISDRWSSRFDLYREWSEAQGHDWAPSRHADVTYVETGGALGIRYDADQRSSYEAQWRPNWRRYTTALSPDLDPWHSGRSDRESILRLSYQRQLDRRHRVEFSWTRDDNTARVSSLAPSTTGEGLGYRENIVQVGYVVGF
ncbi:MAG TPA: hypothetical protein VGM19_00385 [Armatimonadota bacterium]|jgi:hypothetical protein